MYNHTKRTAIKLVEKIGLANLSRVSLSKHMGIKPNSFTADTGWRFGDLVVELRAEGHIGTHTGPLSVSRTSPALRREHLLDCAIALSKDLGYDKFSRVQLAHAAGVSESLISSCFGTMANLRAAILDRAITHEMPDILAQGLAIRDSHATCAPADLKSKACAFLAGY